ncbi:MAG: polysaccharide biosynthesis protein [Proteobacteria bacterium]|nr:polysaccharide biosynthesis protein [Pseudomonadota bacterium]
MRLPSRPTVAYIHDLVVAALSFLIALYLRVGPDIQAYSSDFLLLSTALFTLVSAVVLWRMRLYRGIWRYASLNDLSAIARATTLIIVFFLPAMFLVTRLAELPRSLVVINWFVLMIMLAAPRIAYRFLKDGRLNLSYDPSQDRRVPVLLVGAGEIAEMFIQAMEHKSQADYRVVGLIDDSRGRIGRHIRNVEVLGLLDELGAVVERLSAQGERPQRLIIAKPEIDGARIGRLIDEADGLGLTVARLPQLTEFRAAAGERVELRPVALEDLLGRPQAVLDRPAMRALVHGRRVMVTGAGGTIGGELVRQIAEYGPAHLSLVDNSEYHLYLIDLELSERKPDLPRRPILADLRDRARIGRVVDDERPELVFHAAALKHVPMVEYNPVEGVLTNAIGTRNLAEACRAARVAAMVLISTDKAVNPSSVMGATKRLAEIYCQALDLAERGQTGGTRFLTVRFGNVLGSTGSVVPLFQRQIAAGGPVTVTHAEVRRYFMTVREAVELVLQASALGAAGDARMEGKILVLDMGEPVRILDLARRMISLSGRRPDTDIKIVLTGLRPGEKLNEQLFHAAEPLAPTTAKGILLASPRTADHAFLARGFDELEATARSGDSDGARAALKRLVPEFSPANGADEPAAARDARRLNVST